MNTIALVANSTEQKAVQNNLLLLDGLQGNASAALLDKLKGIELSVLETSRGVTDLLIKVSNMRPDVLILSLDRLEQPTLDQLKEVHEVCPLPVIVVARYYSNIPVETVVTAGVSSYLVDEVSCERMSVIIDLSIARFKLEQSLINELKMTKNKLSERKVIEKAKGIIMKQKHLSEDEAYAQMRKLAMNQGKSMFALAQKIISVMDMLDQT